MMADGARVLLAQIDGSALLAVGDVASYFNATRRACGCFIAYLVSAFGTFDDCHFVSLCFL